MTVRVGTLYYWEGEKPPPLPWQYVDEDGTLIALAGSSARALCKIEGEAEIAVSASSAGDGTGTIDWNTTTSEFVIPATTEGDAVMRVDIEITQGAAVWFLPRFSIPVKKRT